MIRKEFLAMAFAAVLAGPASAETGISVSKPWSRATPGGATVGVAYGVIENKGKDADKLVSAQSPVAETVEIHTHTHEDGVMKMRKVDGVDVAAGATVTLAPGGLHIMLIGLKAPLKAGETVPLVWNFEKAGAVNADAAVMAIGAAGPDGAAATPAKAGEAGNDAKEGSHDGHEGSHE